MLLISVIHGNDTSPAPFSSLRTITSVSQVEKRSRERQGDFTLEFLRQKRNVTKPPT